MQFSPRPGSLPGVRGGQLACFFLVLALVPSTLPAYITELSEDDVNEAYRIGQRHDQSTTKFFADYELTFREPIPGTHVSRISVRTPFCAVALNSYLKGAMYPAFQARADYAKQPYGFAAVVDVLAALPAALTPEDMANPEGQFWSQFKVELSQEGSIPAHFAVSRAEYQQYRNQPTIVGGELYLEYDIREVASKLTHVRVTGPGGSSASADFDLDALR